MRLILTLSLCLIAASTALPADDDLYRLEQQAMQRGVDRVAPSVVQIETFGGRERVGQMLVGTGPTTGVIVAADGYIVSSAFNFVQQPTSILVTLADGQRLPAKIAARDHSRMLVLLKVDLVDSLPVPASVARTQMQIGQWAIAVGKTFEGPISRSVGILSATNRIWGKAIQTDAKVSPNNYGGPLIDIEGRVLGILVPLSPQGRGEIAGNEWYDSGIGFAIPMADVLEVIGRWKTGADLHPGVMGISLVGNDIFTSAARIAACLPNSPASAAGLKAEDVIIEIDGLAIERQVQLKHALGPKYAGEHVDVTVLRGDERREARVLLTDAIEPYEHPFLGILPRRDHHDRIVVRHVFSDSAAQRAGLLADDIILQVGQRDVHDVADCWEAFAALESREDVQIVLERAGDRHELVATLDTLPGDIVDVPVPSLLEAEPAADRPPVGIVEIKVPEFPNECMVYVPQNYDPARRYGLVVWIQNPGNAREREQLIEGWKDHCLQHDLILIAPQPADATRWHPMEVGMIRKALDQVAARYQADDGRVVAVGHEIGGSMALMLAFSNLDRMRGVAASDAPLPTRIRAPATDPLRRLSIFMAYSEGSQVARRVQTSVDQLNKLKYPVTHKQDDAPFGTGQTIVPPDLIRWIGLLDRI